MLLKRAFFGRCAVGRFFGQNSRTHGTCLVANPEVCGRSFPQTHVLWTPLTPNTSDRCLVDEQTHVRWVLVSRPLRSDVLWSCTNPPARTHVLWKGRNIIDTCKVAPGFVASPVRCLVATHQSTCSDTCLEERAEHHRHMYGGTWLRSLYGQMSCGHAPIHLLGHMS